MHIMHQNLEDLLVPTGHKVLLNGKSTNSQQVFGQCADQIRIAQTHSETWANADHNILLAGEPSTDCQSQVRMLIETPDTMNS